MVVSPGDTPNDQVRRGKPENGHRRADSATVAHLHKNPSHSPPERNRRTETKPPSGRTSSRRAVEPAPHIVAYSLPRAAADERALVTKCEPHSSCRSSHSKHQHRRRDEPPSPSKFIYLTGKSNLKSMQRSLDKQPEGARRGVLLRIPLGAPSGLTSSSSYTLLRCLS